MTKLRDSLIQQATDLHPKVLALNAKYNALVDRVKLLGELESGHSKGTTVTFKRGGESQAGVVLGSTIDEGVQKFRVLWGVGTQAKTIDVPASQITGIHYEEELETNASS